MVNLMPTLPCFQNVTWKNGIYVRTLHGIAFVFIQILESIIVNYFFLIGIQIIIWLIDCLLSFSRSIVF